MSSHLSEKVIGAKGVGHCSFILKKNTAIKQPDSKTFLAEHVCFKQQCCADSCCYKWMQLCYFSTNVQNDPEDFCALFMSRKAPVLSRSQKKLHSNHVQPERRRALYVSKKEKFNLAYTPSSHREASSFSSSNIPFIHESLAINQSIKDEVRPAICRFLFSKP